MVNPCPVCGSSRPCPMCHGTQVYPYQVANLATGVPGRTKWGPCAACIETGIDHDEDKHLLVWNQSAVDLGGA